MTAAWPFPEERGSGLSRRVAARDAASLDELRGYLPQRWPKAFDPKPLILDDAPYGPFPRSKRLTADGAIVAVATPGHTRDHLSVIVEDDDKTVFIAGDASYNEETMLDGGDRRRQRRRGPGGRRRSPPSGRLSTRGRPSICPRTILRRGSGSPSVAWSAVVSPLPRAPPPHAKRPSRRTWASE